VRREYEDSGGYRQYQPRQIGGLGFDRRSDGHGSYIPYKQFDLLGKCIVFYDDDLLWVSKKKSLF
jgi:hypothetical protein